MPCVAAQAPGQTLDPSAQQAISQGNAAFAAKHYEEALKAYRRANKIEKEACFSCWALIAQSQKSLKDWDSALTSAGKCLDTAADDAERGVAHIIRGDVYLGMPPSSKNWKAAEAEYRAAVQMQPSDALYHLKLAVALFKESNDNEGLQEAQRCLALNPDGELAASVQQLIANPERARRPFAPEFHLTTLKGETIGLQDLSGKVVVLDFWATWCGPCRESIGELKDLVKKYPQDQFVLISISADSDEQKWREFVAQKKMEWRQYWDHEGNMRRLFQVQEFPTYFVIDRDGSIRDRLVGINPQDSVVHRLKEALPALFAAKPTKK